jgi:peptidoglycan/LPS O-acetylase OafA/YrhL
LKNSIRPKYRPDIDGLRAIAIIAVVAFHTFPNSFKGGFIGVDIFFVISGYLISTIIFENLDRNTFSFAEFYARRIRRIFPALIFVLIVCFVFGWFCLLTDEQKQLGKHIAAGAGFISNIVFWNEAGYFDNASDTKPLLHLWSLSLEEQFYIIWPLLTWFTWKRKFNFLLITIVIAVISFVLNLNGIKQDPVATFYSPQTRFWEFLSGSLLAWATLNKKEIFANITNKVAGCWFCIAYKKKKYGDGKILENILHNSLSFFGLLLLAYGFLLINKDLSFPGIWALMPVIGSLLILAAGSKSFINRTILSNKIAIWFGLISFPLYLWHWPLLTFARIIESEVPSLNIRIAAILLSIVLAWITYKFVECPIRSGKNNKAKVIFLLLTMLVIICAGMLIFKFNLIHNNSYQNKPLATKGAETDAYCQKQFSHKGDLCRAASNSIPTTLILGDSHAAILFSALEEVQFKENLGGNIMLLGQTACPFPAPDRSACAMSFNNVFNTIKNTKSIETVVLASVTIRHYIENNRFKGIALPYKYWAELLGRDLKRLQKIGKKVVIVIDNPMLNFNPKQCDIRPFRITNKNLVYKCYIVASDYYQREKIYREIIVNKAKAYSNVKILDTSSLLCDTKNCFAIKDGTLLYDDHHHLSANGARLIGKELKRLIKDSN